MSMVNWIDKARLHEDRLVGTFLNLASANAVEITAGVGFDWLLIDLEHGSASLADLRQMLIACRGNQSAPIVRLRSVDADTVKFVMDSGAAGIMFPFVNSAAEAREAVEAIKYPPLGRRGVAGVIRATDYGRDWKDYFESANARGLTIVQIETPEAVDSANEIASVEGVDVLFVGPLDLSVNLGVPGQFEHPDVLDGFRRVIAACESAGKTAGILAKGESVAPLIELGFRFVALGSDSGAILTGMRQYLDALRDA